MFQFDEDLDLNFPDIILVKPDSSFFTPTIKKKDRSSFQAPKLRNHLSKNHQSFSPPSDFELLSVLGEGDFSSVWKAKEHSSGVICALKQLRFVDLSFEDSFSEYYYGHLLDHPYLLKYESSIYCSNCLWFKMELCETNLEKELKLGKLCEDFVWKYFLQLLIAVEYIHAHNVIHLDIKPGNILLFFEKDMTSYQIKLGDFGLMLKKKDWKIMHSDGGESGYLAPEVLTECDGINGSADIYSIGVLFFEMIGDYEIDYHFSEIKRIMDYSSFDIPNDNINLIKMMIDDNPLSRPTAYHLIQNTPQFKKNIL